MKALQYVNIGYQRILTFECQSGGFNWWEGNNPGNVILSAMGIMMLRDTQAVYDAVDEKVIERAVQFLETRQNSDGSWVAESHLHAGNENLGAAALRTTCYVAWALQEGGYGKNPSVNSAVSYIEDALGEEKDLYTLGLCANALAHARKNHPALAPLFDRIGGKAIRKDGQVHWAVSEGITCVGSRGVAAEVELTSLIALGMVQSGQGLSEIPKIVDWLISTKDPQGNWGYNTQATVLALKTFLAAATLDTGKTNAGVAATWNGTSLGERKFDNFNKDVVWQLEVGPEQLATGGQLTLDFNGEGNLGYEVVATHYVPWQPGLTQREPLTVEVAYDRSAVKVNDTVTVNVSARANDPAGAGMVLLTLGVPPGFDVLTEDLDSKVQVVQRQPDGRPTTTGLPPTLTTISNYEVTGRQLLIYLNELAVDQEFEVSYRLRARYPVKAQTGPSEARYYYQADKRGFARSALMEAQ